MAERSDRAAASGSLALKSARITATPARRRRSPPPHSIASMPPIPTAGRAHRVTEPRELRRLRSRRPRLPSTRSRTPVRCPRSLRRAACSASASLPTDTPTMRSGPSMRRTAAAGRSSGPTCTPAAPACDREIRTIVHDERYARRQRGHERARYFHLRSCIRIFEPQLYHRRAAAHARQRAPHDVVGAAVARHP